MAMPLPGSEKSRPMLIVNIAPYRAGWLDAAEMLDFDPTYALVAQGIEQRISNPLVAGSNPAEGA